MIEVLRVKPQGKENKNFCLGEGKGSTNARGWMIVIVQKMDCLCRHFFVVVVVRKEIHRMSTQRKFYDTLFDLFDLLIAKMCV